MAIAAGDGEGQFLKSYLSSPLPFSLPLSPMHFSPRSMRACLLGVGYLLNHAG